MSRIAKTINKELALANALYGRVGHFGGVILDINFNEPQIGYITAISKGLEFKSLSAVNQHTVSRWIKDNKSFAKQNGYYFGSWKNRGNDKIYFDIVACFSTKETALKVATKFNQIAVWDIKNKNDIIVVNDFIISGYWKVDTDVKFTGCLVTSRERNVTDPSPSNEQYFFYGINEQDIKNAIELKEKSEYEFIITSYKRV